MSQLPQRARTGAVMLVGLLLTLIALYTSSVGVIEEFIHRGLVAGLSAIVVLLLHPLAAGPLGRTRPGRAIAIILDVAIGLGITASIAWFFYISDELWSGLFVLSSFDIVMASLGMVCFIELCRRCMGLPLALFGVGAVLYCLLGADLPWIFRHAGYAPEEVVRTIWYSLDGAFGIAAAVTVGLIFIYVVFGVVLEGCGASEILLRVSNSLTGRWRGGPAYTAVLASALFGTVSGSAAANVVGTGVFTIPLIKRQGFSPAFAGAVEAAASTGGQLLPPVMGAAAFMMVQLTGIPYLTICAASLLPALFYFANLFCAVGAEARRLGIGAVPPEQRTRIGARDWLLSIQFFAPLIVVLAVLLAGRSPAMAGFWATITAILVTLAVQPTFRRAPWRLVGILARGGEAGARIMVAVVVIGMVIGAINLTGLGLRFSEVVMTLGRESLFVSLVVAMFASLALGMGLPTLPAYLIIVVVIAPALHKLGVPIMLSHLFIIYFAALSAITPPVAIAAYSAAPIAGGSPISTGIVAVRLALVGFIIPFVFIYDPSLTLVVGFSWGELVSVVLRLTASIWLLTSGFAGVGLARDPLPLWNRALRAGAAVALLWPRLDVEIAAVIVALGLLVLEGLRSRRPVMA